MTIQVIPVQNPRSLPAALTKDLRPIFHMIDQNGDSILQETKLYPEYRDEFCCQLYTQWVIESIKGFNAICKKYNFKCSKKCIKALQAYIANQHYWDSLSKCGETPLEELAKPYDELDEIEKQDKYTFTVSRYAQLNIDFIQCVIDNNQN
ncbi:hypothetical protein GUM57_21395 [Vibrio parahaemolyticus]|nr:hypothetical protein [Vibrio parahaemolyticus]